MEIAKKRFYYAIVYGVLATGRALAQNDAPVGPFHAVHMLRIDPQQANAEKIMLAAIADMNQAIVKAGCSSCIYHLWKVSGNQNGRYNYLQISSWPDRAVYENIHRSAAYTAASKEWLELRSVVQEEVYDRFEELEPTTKTLATRNRPPNGYH